MGQNQGLQNRQKYANHFLYKSKGRSIVKTKKNTKKLEKYFYEQ